MPHQHSRPGSSRASSRRLALATAGRLALAAAALIAAPAAVAAHEIPATVTVRAFVVPHGDRLRLLVRAPLAAMRDIDFPLRGPGYLDIARAEPLLREAAVLWIAGSVELFAGGRTLGEPRVVAARASLPSDRSFGSYESALAHLHGPPLPADLELPWQQALLDVLLEVPITGDAAELAIRPTFAHLGLSTTTVLRVRTRDGTERVLQFTGDPGLVRLDPRWHHAALTFVELGFRHILDGIDHLLFLLCLVIPFRQLRPLVVIVTAFTVAHSITLIASALGMAPRALWFPPLVEMLIAASIVFMALENIVGARLERRWAFAFGFGLVHGFGFSFALRESLQFAGAHLATSLVAFNVGVELGQLAVLLLLVPALELTFRYAVAERVGCIILSALVAHTAWHWLAERWGVLRQYRFEWPALDPALLGAAMRWLLLALLVAGAGWALFALFGRWARPSREEPAVQARS
ncbi:MAG: HupE/UreJ family protein [Longimicrobiales bacterium]